MLMTEFMPPDPFLPEGMTEGARLFVALYASMIQAGLPEPRAYDLMRDFFFMEIQRMRHE
jgi:hypothetical protein